MKLLYGLVVQLVATLAVLETIGLMWAASSRPEARRLRKLSDTPTS